MKSGRERRYGDDVWACKTSYYIGYIYCRRAQSSAAQSTECWLTSAFTLISVERSGVCLCCMESLFLIHMQVDFRSLRLHLLFITSRRTPLLLLSSLSFGHDSRPVSATGMGNVLQHARGDRLSSGLACTCTRTQADKVCSTPSRLTRRARMLCGYCSCTRSTLTQSPLHSTCHTHPPMFTRRGCADV